MGNQKKENKEELVSVPKEKWELIIEELARLKQSVSKARLARYDDAHRKPVGKIVKIRTYEGKYVIAWSSMIKNVVEQNPKTGVWHEEQEVEIYFSDKTKKRFAYVIWERNYDKVECEVKSEKIDEKGRKNVTVILPEGDELTIGVEFVN